MVVNNEQIPKRNEQKQASELSARPYMPERKPLGGDAIWSKTHPRIRLWSRSGEDKTNC